jgi:tetratricopeptide (TPR) repeat protein
MNTDGWNPMHRIEDRRDRNRRGGARGPSGATAQAMWRLRLAAAVLLLLPGVSLAAQETSASPAQADTYNQAALPGSLAAGDEQPVADELMRRLWRSRLTAPKPAEDVESNASLTELIERVRSVKFEPKEPTPAMIPEPPSAGLLVEIPAAPQPATESATATAAPTPTAPEETMPTGTIEALRQLLADPNQASDPAEMAELLFLSGRPREAAVFYRKALEIVTRSAPAAKEDRAWVLLQLGNCLRETEPTQARAMYTALATEYPDSPWAELARAQSQFLTWSETAQPRQWISPAKGQEAQDGAPTLASRLSFVQGR